MRFNFLKILDEALLNLLSGVVPDSVISNDVTIITSVLLIHLE